jgi:multiple sugar transport system substrate-binding protein
VSLRVWVPGELGTEDSDWFATAVEEYGNEHNVDFTFEFLSWDGYDQRMLTAFSSGDAPDITYFYEDIMGDYISRGQFLDLEPYITDADRENALYLKNGVYNGHQYAWPYVIGGARVLFYNQAIMDELGETPPATWDDFVRIGKKAVAAGHTAFEAGFSESVAIGAALLPWMWQAGCELINEDATESRIDSPECVETLEFIRDLRYQDGILPENTAALNSADPVDHFAEGRVLFTIASVDGAPQFDEAGLEFGYVTALKNKAQYTLVATDFLVASATTKHPEAAVDAIRYLTSSEFQQKQGEATGIRPLPLNADQQYDADPRFEEVFTTDADMLRGVPVAANMAPLYESLVDAAQSVLLDTKAPQQALADAAAKANEALAKNK